MSRHRIGLSRMQSWGEPFVGESAGDYLVDFQSEYRAHLHGFNRPSTFGFIFDGDYQGNEQYLGPLEHDPVDPIEIEFYNGLTDEDCEAERRINWSGRCTESGRSGNGGFFVKISPAQRANALVRRLEPLSTPEFESLVERIRSLYK